MRRWLVLRAQGQTGRTARITPGWAALGTHHEDTHLFASGDVVGAILWLLSLLSLSLSCRGTSVGVGCVVVVVVVVVVVRWLAGDVWRCDR